MLVVIGRNRKTCEVWRWLPAAQKRSSNVHVETCTTLYTRRKNREQVVTDQKQEVLDMDAFWPAGQNVDNIPQSCHSRKVSKLWFSTRVLKVHKDFSTKSVCRERRVLEASTVWERHNDVRKEHIVNERTTEGGKWSRECVQHQDHRSSLRRVIFNSWRRSNESTCQYMGWNTDLCRFLINSKESKEFPHRAQARQTSVNVCFLH
jgi:hypothetical protein